MKVRKELIEKVARGETLTDAERNEFAAATAPKKTFPQIYAEKFASLMSLQDGVAKFPTEEQMAKAFEGTKYSAGEVAKSYKPAVAEYTVILAKAFDLLRESAAAVKKASK